MLSVSVPFSDWLGFRPRLPPKNDGVSDIFLPPFLFLLWKPNFQKTFPEKSLKQTIFLLVPFWFGFWFSWSDESWLIWVWFNSLSFFLLIPFSFNWASDCLISRGVGFSLRIPSSTTKKFWFIIHGFSISYCDFSEGL